jgi:hypothetical protein
MEQYLYVDVPTNGKIPTADLTPADLTRHYVVSVVTARGRDLQQDYDDGAQLLTALINYFQCVQANNSWYTVNYSTALS